MTEIVAEIPDRTGAITSEAPTKPKPNKRRAKVRVDLRYAVGRRVKQLMGVFRAKLKADADDPVVAAAITRAAELVALAEDLRGRALRGEAVPADDVVRVTRLADQSVRALQLDRHKPSPSGPTLAEAIRQDWSNGDA